MLLATNNCLLPSSTANRRAVYHMDHEVKAEPMNFFLEGYDETQFYIDAMRRCLEAFLGLPEAEVDEMQAASTHWWTRCWPPTRRAYRPIATALWPQGTLAWCRSVCLTLPWIALIIRP